MTHPTPTGPQPTGPTQPTPPPLPKTTYMRKWLIGVATVILIACAGGTVTPREGKACHHLGRTVAHGGTVLTCKQGPGKDQWTWQRDKQPLPKGRLTPV